MTDFYRGKRVCVLGGAGMLGASLVAMLVDLGASVLVIDDYSRGDTPQVKGARYMISDAGEGSYLYEHFKGIDAVFNLAASVGGVLYNQKHHALMFHENVRLQTAPVVAAKYANIPHFLQVSSVCVYAEDKQNPCIESDIGGEPNGANAGYALAKRMGERAMLWAELPHGVIVRPANLYGINDYFDDRAHVIPALIKKIIEDDVIKVNGRPDTVREFLYVDDAARGLITAMELGEANGVYNIGSDGANSCTIGELVYTLRDILEVDKSIEFTGGNGGDARRIVNGDKLMRLGWKAQVSLIDGLRRVCEWYKAE